MGNVPVRLYRHSHAGRISLRSVTRTFRTSTTAYRRGASFVGMTGRRERAAGSGSPWVTISAVALPPGQQRLDRGHVERGGDPADKIGRTGGDVRRGAGIERGDKIGSILAARVQD